VSGIFVVGGGPAGAALACRLARAGRAVTVFEREQAPAHVVCGEFLGGDALAQLAALGIDVLALGGHKIECLRLVRGNRMAEVLLPFPAAGVSRRALDAALLQAAEAAGANVLRGRPVRRLCEGRIEVAGLGEIEPKALFLATGKHELRGAQRRLTRPPEDLIGFKTHLHLSPDQAAALRGAVELLLFSDSYAGLQMIAADTANLCLLVNKVRLARAGGWDGLLKDLCDSSPHLARRLRGAEAWPRPLAIAQVPYGFVHRARRDDGVFRLGDQMGVIASFAGDGVAIALRTAELAADCFVAGGSTRDYHRRARAAIAGPIRLSSLLYRGGRVPAVQATMMALAKLSPRMVARAGLMTRVT
jgi:flavin-dependent dehydrogenase